MAINQPSSHVSTGLISICLFMRLGNGLGGLLCGGKDESAWHPIGSATVVQYLGLLNEWNVSFSNNLNVVALVQDVKLTAMWYRTYKLAHARMPVVVRLLHHRAQPVPCPSRWQSFTSTTTFLPLARCLPCSMHTIMVQVGLRELRLYSTPTNHLDRRCGQCMGNQCLL